MALIPCNINTSSCINRFPILKNAQKNGDHLALFRLMSYCNIVKITLIIHVNKLMK